jgi:spore coat protein H
MLRLLAFGLLAALVPSAGLAQTPPATPPAAAVAAKADPSIELFTPGKIQKFKITVDEDSLRLLKKEPRKYVRCTVVVGTETFVDVGIHIKGAAGSTRDWDDRPALTLNFDKFKDKQKLKGLDKIHLNNSVQDGTVMNEILYSEAALATGVPTARAGLAIVTLNGRKVGLYGLKEGYNSAFIQQHFPKAKDGNFYEGGFLQDIDGEMKLIDGPGNEKKDVKELIKACQIADAKKRYDAVSALVDVDKLAIDTALQILTADWDGYARQRNNYRIYFPPNGGKAVFIPHGKDQLWQNPTDALWHGWGGMVTRSIADHPDGKKLIIAKMNEISTKQFDLEKLTKRIDEWSKPAQEALAVVNKDHAKNYENEIKGLKDRLKQRADFMKKELPKLK